MPHLEETAAEAVEKAASVEKLVVGKIEFSPTERTVEDRVKQLEADVNYHIRHSNRHDNGLDTWQQFCLYAGLVAYIFILLALLGYVNLGKGSE